PEAPLQRLPEDGDDDVVAGDAQVRTLGKSEAEAADAGARGEAAGAVVEAVRLAVVAGDEVGAAVAVQVAERERLRARRIRGERGRRERGRSRDVGRRREGDGRAGRAVQVDTAGLQVVPRDDVREAVAVEIADRERRRVVRLAAHGDGGAEALPRVRREAEV